MLHCTADGARLVAAPPPESLEGHVVDGRFRVGRVLGEGAMGTVYRATQLSVDRPVALKVLRRHLVRDEESVRRFLREARAATRLNHPHVVTAYDFGQTGDGLLWLAMELVDGRSLAQVLAVDAPLPQQRACAIARQICEALVEAHGKGIVHRDLKPENIALCAVGGRRDFVKVLDFGIARFLNPEDGGRVTATGTVIGTPCYMSPEQTRGQPFDARADIYSLGVMLFEMLSGRLPFAGPSTIDMLMARLEKDPPSLLETGVSDDAPSIAPVTRRSIPPDVTPLLDHLVQRMMARSREDRPPTAAAVIAELDLAEGEGHVRAAGAPSSGGQARPSPTVHRPVDGMTTVRAPMSEETRGLPAMPAVAAGGADAPTAVLRGRVPGSADAETVARPEVASEPAATRGGPWRLLAAAVVGVVVVSAAVLAALPASEGGRERPVGFAAGGEAQGQAERRREGEAQPVAEAASQEAPRMVAAVPAGESLAVADTAAAAFPPSGPALPTGGPAVAPPGEVPVEAPAAAEVTVTIASSPTGATVSEGRGKDRRVLGKTPHPLTASPSAPPRRVRVTLAGHTAVDLDVTFEREREAHVVLQRILPQVGAREQSPEAGRLVNDPSELK
ncbi:MAG: hypothetical protein AMXMBFR64_14080 [Myxococcales bacterium]